MLLSSEEALNPFKRGYVLLQPSVENLVHILHICRKDKRRVPALRVHAYILKCGLNAHISLGNYVVPMLVEAGCMLDAHQAFDRLVSRNGLCWNALISGYIKSGMPQHALVLYRDLQAENSVRPSGFTFVALLKACVKLKDLKNGVNLHSEVARMGFLGSDLFVGSGLVDMYVKFGLLNMAEEVFDELPARDAVLWTSLISGHAEFECGDKAFDCFHRMQLESIAPDVTTFACILKACGSVGDIKKCQEIHVKVAGVELFEDNIFVGSALVYMYAKCGSLATAQTVFDKVRVRNVVLWTALITGYVEHGCFEDAIKCFDQMKLEGVSPDMVTIVCTLKACGTICAAQKGVEIHVEIERLGLLEKSLGVGSALVDMYVCIGAQEKAQEVFDNLPGQDIDAWNALIAGYAEHGYVDAAVKCFEQMELEGISPNATTFVCISKACSSTGAMDKAKEILLLVERNGWLEQDIFVGSTLVDAYAKCGLIERARQVFDKLPARTVVSWNALIAGYEENGHSEEALKCYERMQLEGIVPDAVTFIFCLKACGSIGALDKVEELHAHIDRQGLLDRDLVGNTLVLMYAKSGSLRKAQVVFDSLADRNVVTWTALIAGHAEHGHGEEALSLLEQMQREGISPDVYTYVYSLKACGDVGAIGKGEEIHAEIERQGLLEKNLAVGNSLLDMYAKCGLLVKAQEVFDNLLFRDVVTWNTLVAAYAEQGRGEEAIKCYEQMQLQGVSPDAITLVCSLKACGSIGAQGKGWEIQAEIERQGLLERDLFVGSTLVDIYAKWGLLEKAQQMFDILPVRDVVSWNALMTAYAQFGRSENVFWFFNRMVGEGIKPDPVTFVVVLGACNRTGLLTKSQSYFEAMSKDYGILPTSEHHNCMVNLLSHAGHLDKAVSVIKKMPVSPSLEMWHTLLSACRDWGSVEFGKQAFEDAVRLDAKNAVAYVMMSHIYAGADWLVKRNKFECFVEASG